MGQRGGTVPSNQIYARQSTGKMRVRGLISDHESVWLVRQTVVQ
jgi:hypothetical protein